MADTGYSIEIELVKAEGECVAGHRVGDKFFVDGDEVRFGCSGLCIHALYSMLPKILAMRYGARFPWAKDDPDTVTHACPDAANPHTFVLRRLQR
ncbi:MAG: TIGR04076 family protein [Candidatus Bipolaricaulaceae bacterium]